MGHSAKTAGMSPGQLGVPNNTKMFSPSGTKDLRSSLNVGGKKVSDLAMVQGAHISPI